MTNVVAVTVAPLDSVAVIVMPQFPAPVYVCCAVGLAPVVLGCPSPQLNEYDVAGTDVVAVAVTVRGGVVTVALTVAVGAAVTMTT